MYRPYFNVYLLGIIHFNKCLPSFIKVALSCNYVFNQCYLLVHSKCLKSMRYKHILLMYYMLSIRTNSNKKSPFKNRILQVIQTSYIPIFRKSRYILMCIPHYHVWGHSDRQNVIPYAPCLTTCVPLASEGIIVKFGDHRYVHTPMIKLHGNKMMNNYILNRSYQ